MSSRVVTSISYDFSRLPVDARAVADMMGYRGMEPPEPVPELISEVLSEAGAISEIRGGYVLIPDVRFPADKKTVLADGRILNTAKTITSALRKSGQLLIFLFTAGKRYGELSRQYLSEGNPMKGYVVDVLGSITVDTAVQKMQDQIEDEFLQRKLQITNRYSPGYCEWPVTDQETIFSFFPGDFAGIHLSESFLMDPIKSVSGVIGIGAEVKKTAYNCAICSDKNCLYRNPAT